MWPRLASRAGLRGVGHEEALEGDRLWGQGTSWGRQGICGTVSSPVWPEPSRPALGMQQVLHKQPDEWAGSTGLSGEA